MSIAAPSPAAAAGGAGDARRPAAIGALGPGVRGAAESAGVEGGGGRGAKVAISKDIRGGGAGLGVAEQPGTGEDWRWRTRQLRRAAHAAAVSVPQVHNLHLSLADTAGTIVVTAGQPVLGPCLYGCTPS